MASYGVDLLQSWVPEQSGKWKIAELPFGLTGVEKDSGSSLAISSTSEHKLLAWEFIKIASRQMFSMYSEPREVEFFGGQEVNAIYKDILERGQKGQPLPLDRKAKFLWDVELSEFNYGKEITPESIEQLEKSIFETIRIDQRAIQNMLDNNPSMNESDQ